MYHCLEIIAESGKNWAICERTLTLSSGCCLFLDPERTIGLVGLSNID